jgi:UDPglucose 6-dehydrogenase
MNVGFVGLGKLGLPVALAIEAAGHTVCGYDKNELVRDYLRYGQIPFKEEGLQPLLDTHKVKWAPTIREVVRSSEIIFVPVQTPHDPQFEGATRIPAERADFDYSYLTQAVGEIGAEAKAMGKSVMVVVISTCLPGTYRAKIRPLLNEFVQYVYNPFFIAMGTVLADFTNPEFVLIGQEGSSKGVPWKLRDLYHSIHDKPLFVTDITTAEGIKVFYNTFITMKTVLANTYGEMSEKLGMNVDDIFAALSLATDRIISPKYLKAGMGDGGGCHPRDNIALSYIAERVGLSHNIFEDLMAAREDHAEWLADLVLQQQSSLPVIMLGRAFKPETNIETGSPAVLVANILREKGVDVHHVEDANTEQRAIWFIGTQHSRYQSMRFKEGSIVIDPFGYISDQTGVRVIRIGRP